MTIESDTAPFREEAARIMREISTRRQQRLLPNAQPAEAELRIFGFLGESAAPEEH
jgi:hypothetical protein